MKTKKINKKEIIGLKKKAKKTGKKSLTKNIVRAKSKEQKKKKVSTKINKTEKTIRAGKKETEENSYFAKWIAPEHIKTQQDVLVYYTSAVISIIAVVWFFWQGSLIPSITFLVLLIVIVLYIYQEPHNIEFKIDLDGIAFGNMFYKYNNIESFEVVEGEYLNILKFKLKSSFFPVKEIEIVDQDPHYIRAVLEYFLLEEKQEEALFSSKKKNEIDEYFSEEDFDDYLKEKEKLKKLEDMEKNNIMMKE